jgi:hypothetical protein
MLIGLRPDFQLFAGNTCVCAANNLLDPEYRPDNDCGRLNTGSTVSGLSSEETPGRKDDVKFANAGPINMERGKLR